MSEYVKLKIGNDNYSVIDCHCHFSRDYNHAEPISNARCERVDLLINYVDAGDLVFYKWFVNKETKSGSVIFFQDESQKNVIKEIKFETARCFSLTEEFESFGTTSTRTIKLSFMADTITVSDVTFNEG
jgi:hypothetical protein